MPAPTLAPPVEDAFAVHVHHAPLSRGDIWLENRHTTLPNVPRGGVFVFDLRTEPLAQIHEPFEFSRFQISRMAMDDLAYEHGLGRLGDLRATGGAADPVVQHLALAMLRRVELGRERDTLFTDGIALAFFAHIARQYADAELPILGGVLAPWQIRRIGDWVDAHLHESMSIGDLAALVNMSPSHFSRLFSKTLGVPPHRWLLLRRIERAKQLLKGVSLLAQIAAHCGFVDQSHFTRVFTQIERISPGGWRRQFGKPFSADP